MDINTVTLMFVLGTVATIAATILAYIHIIPADKRGGLNTLGQFLHDVFNFKFLVIEKILKFLYVLCTVACVCYGVCMIFAISVYNGYYDTYTTWYGPYGVLIAILGPIAIRVVYEVMIMGVLLVQNVIEINKKLKYQTEEEDAYKMPTIKELVAKENFEFLKKDTD